jgi:hypothetical protein
MKVTLIMILWLTAGGEPEQAKVEAPDLKTCMEYAQKFLESATVKKAAAASSGCVVANIPEQDS